MIDKYFIVSLPGTGKTTARKIIDMDNSIDEREVMDFDLPGLRLKQGSDRDGTMMLNTFTWLVDCLIYTNIKYILIHPGMFDWSDCKIWDELKDAKDWDEISIHFIWIVQPIDAIPNLVKGIELRSLKQSSILDDLGYDQGNKFAERAKEYYLLWVLNEIREAYNFAERMDFFGFYERMYIVGLNIEDNVQCLAFLKPSKWVSAITHKWVKFINIQNPMVLDRGIYTLDVLRWLKKKEHESVELETMFSNITAGEDEMVEVIRNYGMPYNHRKLLETWLHEANVAFSNDEDLPELPKLPQAITNEDYD